jgi:hypothetical protein
VALFVVGFHPYAQRETRDGSGCFYLGHVLSRPLGHRLLPITRKCRRFTINSRV